MDNCQTHNARFASVIRKMGEQGQSAYGNVDGEAVHDIPAQACKGHSGNRGGTFSGYFDEEHGKIRVDCADDPCFWLEIDLAKMPRFANEPGGQEARRAKGRFHKGLAEPGETGMLGEEN